mgnify:CR=1 FL=1
MKIYTYAKCDTCRKAVKWLRARDLEFTEIPIREQPPTKAELKRMLAIYDGDLKRLFNTSGGDYRELKLGEKLPAMSEATAARLERALAPTRIAPAIAPEQRELLATRDALLALTGTAA